MSSYIFTITAGRTGTAWLTNFIWANLKIPSVHEPLEIDDFGVQMPDIKTMRSFNDRGMNDIVLTFWRAKFDALKDFHSYAETNHTLAKCGLIEFAATHQKHNEFTFLCVRRNRVTQCISYVTRGDFVNITIDWQWYLNYRYKRRIVEPTLFLEYGRIGKILWYIFEIEARQDYYKLLYARQFKFIDATLEEMTQPDGARVLLETLGSLEAPILGEKANENRTEVAPDLRKRVENAVERITVDPKEAAIAFIERGDRLG
jgi:hypothetical protein